MYEHRQMQGLGWWQGLVAMGTSMMAQRNQGNDGGGGGSSSESTAITTTVETNVQVSPQISPQFIQQQSPSNSPITAGITGTLPGFDYGSGYVPTGLPALPVSFQQAGINPVLIVAGIAGLIGFAMLSKRRSNGKKK